MPSESLRTGDEPRAQAPAPTDFKLLYRKLEDALAQIERVDNVAEMLEAILQNLIDRFGEDLGFEGGRIYRREGDDFFLCCGLGKSRDAPIGFRVPRDYPPHLRTLSEGLLIVRPGDPEFDQRLEESIGVTSTFAAIAVGEGNSYIVALSIRGEVREEQVLYSLTALRHVINLKLRQEKASGVIEQSRIIHEVILPARAPAFAGYDIDGRSRAAEIVGGDLFDYLPLSADRLGIAIVDSSGHGLPAALLARDVITGLRMGVGETSQIVPTIERLNQVIHRAALSSKFVSLFYGELRHDGTFIYCNAGHNPPLLRRGASFVELDRGGTVLGPIPRGRYESAEVRLAGGEVLVLYTDGVVERRSRGGEMFGETRLRELLRGLGDAGAKEIVNAVIAAVDEHGRGVPPDDDITVLAVRKS